LAAWAGWRGGACIVGVGAVGAAIGLSGRIHNPVVGSRFPVHTSLCLKNTLHLDWLYVTLQSASHSVLMDTREAWAKPGTIWALQALLGSQGTLSLHSWVEAICLPSGRFMMIGVMAGVTSDTGVPGTRKWPVAPASAMVWSLAMWIPEVWKRASLVGGLQLLTAMVASSSLSYVCCEVGVGVGW